VSFDSTSQQALDTDNIAYLVNMRNNLSGNHNRVFEELEQALGSQK
jgi:hypothetical protein